MDRGLLDHVKTVGMHFERRLRALALKYPVIAEVRGAGLMRGRAAERGRHGRRRCRTRAGSSREPDR